ncbi:MAG TPA: succinate dehydrogenase, hydrophobic membrane anchor protein [Nitrosomonas sp.]|uniref:succinate dehydrogenase, hydrophobic membrane anchor protein n=1 Tax=Nitrosomonas sp. TaxID=42353 RepID=UPI000E84ED61|nr:succinate dehydrogenase, hydrophobic membrane anchor protein [Nitrosomonas sp.]GJL75353.1 MAG: succinate dehydrogenase, hydrophobic membrane anchor protein [Nitrosomonas sp.]HBV20488.1 succinate dehydrogenase, hydrophobic membrane anchor protein [Nitrosomonas sp.]
MVKQSGRIVTGAHYGLRDWMAQRVTAVLMAVYILLLAIIVWTVAPQDYAAWASIFNNQWMRIATFLFFACLFWHAWVGVRNVLMDYVKPAITRLVLQILVIISLLVYLVWTAEILWS